jgi:hypothetical protein
VARQGLQSVFAPSGGAGKSPIILDRDNQDFADQLVDGLGGCVAVGGDLDRLVRSPWREVRRRVAGLPVRPLCAYYFYFSRRRTAEHPVKHSIRFAPPGCLFSNEARR